MFGADAAASGGVPPVNPSGDPAGLSGDRHLRSVPAGLAGHDHDWDQEEIDELTEAAVQLSCLECATRLELMRLVARLDQAKVWRRDGQTCLANWIALQFGVSRRTARQYATVARHIDELPALAAAFGEGRISWDQLVPLCELATSDTDAAWAHDGAGFSPEDLHKMVTSRQLSAERARDIHDRRGITFRRDRAGGTVTSIYGDPTEAEAFRVALDRERDRSAVADPETGEYPSVAQQRYDALGLIVHRDLGADADLDRATIVLHSEASVVTDHHDGHATLTDGTPVAAETVRRLACDGRIEWAIDGPDGVTLGIGRASRTWPAWLARQISHRDGGRCRFPGCPNRIHHIHHTAEWVAHKGRTDTCNGAGYCWTHHRLVHEGQWTVTGNADHTLTFTSPDGRVVLTSPVRKLRPDVKRRMRGTAPGLFEDD